MRRTRSVVILLAFLAGLPVIGTAIGSFIDGMREKQRLSGYVESLRMLSTAVAADGTRLLRTPVTASGACSDADLHVLRELLFTTHHLADIGRVKDGSIYCSAIWGRLTAPSPLPPAHRHSPTDTLFWRNASNPISPKITSDIAANATMVVFTSPLAFSAYRNGFPDVESYVTSRDLTYVFQSFPAQASPGRLAERLASSTLRVQQCASNSAVDICVTAFRTGYYHYATLTLGTVGAVIGILLSLAFWFVKRSHARSLSGGLERAFAHGDIKIQYQAIRRLDGGEIVGAEALSRWTHPELGPIAPPTFIGWAEALGFGRTFTRYVARRVLAEANDLLRQPNGFYISINVSPADLEDPTFLPFLLDLALENEVSPQRVALEVTESAQFSKSDGADTLAKFRAEGFRIFIDDFGCGYSNLSSLVQWPIDVLKIDQSFVKAVATNTVAGRILERVIELAESMNLQAIAEGVETLDQSAMLLRRSATICGQGWALGRPCPIQEFRDSLNEA